MSVRVEGRQGGREGGKEGRGARAGEGGRGREGRNPSLDRSLTTLAAKITPARKSECANECEGKGRKGRE